MRRSPRLPTSRFLTTRCRISGRRGSALLLAILFLFMLYLMASAFQILVPAELNSALHEKLWVQGAYAADAGIAETLAHLESFLAGDSGATYPTSNPAYTGTLASGWTWATTVAPDPENGNTAVQVYYITATAFLDGNVRHVMRVIATQDSFARYASYSDQWPATEAEVPGHNQVLVSGPMHSNGTINVVLSSAWYSGSHTVVPFQGDVTQAAPGWLPGGYNADGLNYYNASSWSDDPSVAPWYSSSAARYSELFQNGRSGVTSDVKPIYMPSTTKSIRSAALGNGPVPAAGGVAVNTSGGGVFVNGNADIAFSSPGGLPTTTVTTAGGATTITENPRADTTTVSSRHGTESQIGLPNGAIFVAGDVTRLSGPNNAAEGGSGYRGRYTVSADVANGGNVYVTGSIQRWSQGTPGTDSLGIVGTNVYLGSSMVGPPQLPQTLTIDAALYAGRSSNGNSIGGVNIYNKSWTWNGAPGNLIINGGTSEAVIGVTATYQQTGYYNEQINYDPDLASRPPPFYPTYSKLRVCYYGTESSF